MNTPSRQIYINYFDLERLNLLIKSQGDLQKPEKRFLRDLAADLEDAVVVSSGGAIPFVVTMNSRVRLKNIETGDVTEHKLVFPGKSNKGLGKLSVLTPVGAETLGRREIDELNVTTPSGIERLRIEKIVHQPEASEIFS